MENEFNTTIEQSNLLIELRLPSDSCDCYFKYEDGDYNVVVLPPHEKFSTIAGENDVPCWTDGNLQQIYDICWNNPEINKYERMFSEHVILSFIEDCENNNLDFTRLVL